MCVVSMVHDHFQPRIPEDWKPNVFAWPWTTPGLGVAWPYVSPDAAQVEALRQEVAALRQTVADFRAVVEAAKKVDALTQQPR